MTAPLVREAFRFGGFGGAGLAFPFEPLRFPRLTEFFRRFRLTLEFLRLAAFVVLSGSIFFITAGGFELRFQFGDFTLNRQQIAPLWNEDKIARSR